MHLRSTDVQVVLTLYLGQSVRLHDLLLVTTEQYKIHLSQLFSCQPSIPDNNNTIISITCTHSTTSHLRSKGTASAYILYCTGSGMLTRYMHN